MIEEHSREDELIVQMIGLQGTIDKLKREKQELISEFVEGLEEFELKRYSDMMRTLTRLRKKYEAMSK